MNRKNDLEQSIRECYSLISQYEAIRRDTDRPEEHKRAQRIIDEQWDLIRGYLDEYLPLCQRLGVTIPNDIAQIAARFAKGSPEVTTSSDSERGVVHKDTPVHLAETRSRVDKIRLGLEIAKEHRTGRIKLTVT